MPAKIPDLTEALIGRFDDHHAALVRQILARRRHIHDAKVVLDELIADQPARLRCPADSCIAAATPTQAASRADEPNRDMSPPVSA